MVWLVLAAAVCTDGWRADAEEVARRQAKRPDFTYAEAEVPEYTLPPAVPEGATADSWRSHQRRELVARIQTNVYGVFPSGAAVLYSEGDAPTPSPHGVLNADYARVAVDVQYALRKRTLTGHLFLPPDAKAPVPVFVLIDHRGVVDDSPGRGPESGGFWPVEAILAAGYGTLAFRTEQIDPDEDDGFRNGLHALFADRREAESATWSTIAAWAWGASRFVDAVGRVEGVDADRIAVIGHSRGGKTALCAGAYDPRIALTIANESGCGGAALSRRRFGETVERINRVFPHWFCDRFSDFDGREDELPIDQHSVIAAIAPRAVCVGSADRDLWADPRGEYLGLKAADPAFALYGDGPLSEMPPLDTPVRTAVRGYHIRSGGHDLTDADWAVYLDFADHLWCRE